MQFRVQTSWGPASTLQRKVMVHCNVAGIRSRTACRRCRDITIRSSSCVCGWARLRDAMDLVLLVAKATLGGRSSLRAAQGERRAGDCLWLPVAVEYRTGLRAAIGKAWGGEWPCVHEAARDKYGPRVRRGGAGEGRRRRGRGCAEMHGDGWIRGGCFRAIRRWGLWTVSGWGRRCARFRSIACGRLGS